ncbi:MAG: hypothetical protein LAO77_08020 [Acidobacteriia bacterium]|nr:hypothetical protein [Terriglobia bacterium]
MFYGVLTLGMTFPLVTKLSSHVPMPEYLQNEPWRHVYWFLLWSLWLAKKSVGLWPPLALSTTLIFYPAGVVLPTIVQVVSAAVVALPLLGALNLVAVGNILMLLGITFAGYFAFLLAEYVTADRAASLLAGVVFAFSPIVGANLQGHLYVVTGLPWIPLYLLFVLKTLDHPTKGNALRAGGIFAITMLSYWYYAAFLVVFTGVLVLASLLSAERRLDLRALVVPTLSFAAVVIPVTIILAIPFLLPSTRNWLAAAPLQSSLAEMKDWSVDALAFFLPAYDHWLFGGAVRGIRASFGGNFTLQTAYLGYTPIVLAAVAVAKAARHAARPWAWSAVVFFFFALGPFLHLGGVDRNIPLPQHLIYWLPPFSGVRDLSMYVVPLMLALALLASLGLSALLRERSGLTRSALLIGTIGLALAEFAVLPFPLFAAQIPAAYRDIARDPDPGAVLELPLSTTTPMYQYYQTVHGKPLLSGYLNRLHPWYEDFADSFPVMKLLRNPPETDPGEAVDAGDFLRLFHIRYVVIHRRIAGEPQSRRLAALVVNAFPLRLLADDGETIFYRVEGTIAATPLPIVLDFSPDHPDPALTMGWAQSERRDQEALTAAWAEGTTSRVWVDLRDAKSVGLTLKVQPFSYAGAPPQRLSLTVNGTAIGSTVLPDGWSVQTFPIPDRFLVPGVNRMDFEFNHCGVPAVVAPGSSDTRCLSVAFDYARIETANSAAKAPQ